MIPTGRHSTALFLVVIGRTNVTKILEAKILNYEGRLHNQTNLEILIEWELKLTILKCLKLAGVPNLDAAGISQ